MVAPKPTEINDARLAASWHALISPEAELIPRSAYEDAFDGVDPGPAGMTKPWPDYGEQDYWRRYLGGAKLKTQSAAIAWKHQVPLRVGSPLAIGCALERVRAGAEVLVHPWGLSAICTSRVAGPLKLEELVELAGEMFRARVFSIDSSPEPVSLAAVGEAAISNVSDALGGAGASLTDAISVTGVISATGDPRHFDPNDDSVRRALQALTLFSKTWRDDALLELEESRVAGKQAAPAGHIVYGRHRGRTIWSPSSFLTPGSTVGCHFRNLVLATTQTEALIELARRSAAQLAAGRGLAPEQSTQVGRTVGALARLYYGRKDQTYRSGAIKNQIGQRDNLADINRLRTEEFGLPAIA